MKKRNPLAIYFLSLAAVVAMIGVIAAAVEIGSRLKPTNQILAEAPEAEPEHLLKIRAYANVPGEKGETRALSELSDRLIAGALMETKVIKDASGNEIPTFSAAKDDWLYRDPIIVLESDGKIEAKYSAAIGEGWLRFGESKENLTNSNRDATAAGYDRLVIQPNISDFHSVKPTFLNVREDMRGYNRIEKLRIRDLRPDVLIPSDEAVFERACARLFIKVYDRSDDTKLIASAEILIEDLSGCMSAKNVIDAGRTDILSDRELFHHTSLTLENYEQIEIIK